MSDIVDRFTNLSAEKRKLLLKKLQQQGQVSNLPTKSSPIKRISRDNLLPLSFAQERLWFLDQFMPGNSFYNIPTVEQYKGPLDIKALEEAFCTLVARHETLRTTFQIANGQPVQTITPELKLTLPLVDLCNLPEKERDKQMWRLIAEETERPFDLTTGPLLRTKLLRLNGHDHILILTIHHIISDGWSADILGRDVSTLYEAITQGKIALLPELPVQYVDYAMWQREQLQGDVLEKQIHYWKQQLAGAPPLLNLPTDHPRPAIQTFRGAPFLFTLPKDLTEKLKLLSLQENVTLFMVLLAAFKVLLSRYTGQEDIVVGSAIANRHRVEIKDLIGFFVNTLVLRTNLAGNPTFRELLSRVHKVTLEAYTYQDFPFEKLVEELQPERDLSRNPLIQVMFTFQNIPMTLQPRSGFTITPIEYENQIAKFDLDLYMREGANGLYGCLVYNTDLFDAITIKEMLDHFQVLLKSIVTNHDQKLSALSILTDVEQHQLIVGLNETWQDYSSDQCIHELFEAQVAQTPGAIAAVFADQSFTYAELNHHANQLAHYLHALNLQPDTLVGICLERSLTMLVGLLGVLKAGAAYVPLDPHFPHKRLDTILGDTAVEVILTETQLRKQLTILSDKHVLCLDDPATLSLLSHQPTTNLPRQTCRLEPHHLAYVIHTSGSTGKPKGIKISHQSVVNFLQAMHTRLNLTSDDVLQAVTTISFDIAALELYLPLITGATVVIVTREVAGEGHLLVNSLQKNAVTVMQATPTTWQMLLAAGWQGTPHFKILCGGESLSLDLAHQLLQTGQVLWNLYGPTETTIWSTCYQVNKANISHRPSVPIGNPIANTQVFVLDKHLNLVPRGVWGELHIGGVGIARGYHNHPRLTAEKFIPNPYSSKIPRENTLLLPTVLYKTGDMVRYLVDGTLEFLGRIDHQVKLRGFRIELGEIEVRLSELAIVDGCIVTVREDRPGDKQLIAYVITSANSNEYNNLVHMMRSHLQACIPSYMVPSAFVFLETFPLTPNGKINRQALPAPQGLQIQAHQTYIQPHTELERTLATLWQEVLQVERVGLHDNFFDLGGHSLLAVLLHRRVQEVLQLNITLIDLFAYPTLHTFADYVRQKDIVNHLHPAPTKTTRNVGGQISLQRQRQIRQTLRYPEKGEQGG